MNKEAFHRMRGKKAWPVFLLALLVAALFLYLGARGSAVTDTASQEDKGPRLVLFLPWGSGPWSVGKKDAPESAPEGPMSFAITPSGGTAVLDQVNARILEFDPDGTPLKEVPLPPGAFFQDIEIGKNGDVVLLDRLVRSSVVVLDGDGREVAEHAVHGPGIPEGGGVTASFLGSDGLWLEYNHEHVVRLLDGSLEECARTVLPGRHAGPGTRQVVAALHPGGGAVMHIVDPSTDSTVAGKVLSFDWEIRRIVWIEGDRGGGLHCVFHLVKQESPGAGKPPREKVAAVKLDGSLERKGSFESPYTIGAPEQFREFKAAGEDKVYQMAFTNEGASIFEWRYVP